MADHEAKHDEPARRPQPGPPSSEIRRHARSLIAAETLPAAKLKIVRPE
jgi:hypothetical protein